MKTVTWELYTHLERRYVVIKLTVKRRNEQIYNWIPSVEKLNDKFNTLEICNTLWIIIDFHLYYIKKRFHLFSWYSGYPLSSRIDTE